MNIQRIKDSLSKVGISVKEIPLSDRGYCEFDFSGDDEICFADGIFRIDGQDYCPEHAMIIMAEILNNPVTVEKLQ